MSESPAANTASPFVRTFGSSGRTRIVEAFLGKRGAELTAAEVAKLAGVDRSTVSRNVDALVDAGLVGRRETSSGVLYRADVDDSAVRALSNVRRALLGSLAENSELVERDPDQDPSSEAYVDRSGLVRLFASPGRAKMIEVFVSARNEELTGTDIAERAGVDRSTVSRNVDELVTLGIVQRTRRVGTAKLYRFDEDHPLGGALLSAWQELHAKQKSTSGTSRQPTGPNSMEPADRHVVERDHQAGRDFERDANWMYVGRTQSTETSQIELSTALFENAPLEKNETVYWSRGTQRGELILSSEPVDDSVGGAVAQRRVHAEDGHVHLDVPDEAQVPDGTRFHVLLRAGVANESRGPCHLLTDEQVLEFLNAGGGSVVELATVERSETAFEV